MSSDNVWHATRTKSWWDGSVTTWCGLRTTTSESLSEYWYLGPVTPKCPACQAAKKAGK
ncbi:hypothetical protein MOQ72_41875 [Saccharopolyspora sp. K220]|uniref:hypothetical protein n=1 Tax=Saccharopolyspora soli TaxID=2926618 RepID=UPI001F571A9F|nr:hypothetical protein [Saccharopolyspora soli]MCI2423968.1 hypothetical protein [Saccharopolyspora soli]